MTQEVQLRRTKCNYKEENARFLLECDFSKQYAHYYNTRLEKTKPFLEFNCRLKWTQTIPILKLTELTALADHEFNDGIAISSQSTPDDGTAGNFENPKRLRKFSESLKQSKFESPVQRTSTQKVENDEKIASTSGQLQLALVSPIGPRLELDINKQIEYIVIGTIFKRMKLQPDVVQELSEGDFHINCERYLGHYTSQDDKLVLEDSDETISLVGNIEPGKLVTGVVVALLGYPIDDCSQFFVKDICYAEPNRLILDYEECSQETIDKPLALKPVYLMAVSGFGFHQNMEKENHLTRALQELIDFIWGGLKYVDDERSSQVARILVIGDNLLEDSFDEETASQKGDLATKMKQSRQVKPYANSIQAVKHMDDFFAQLSKTINVDVMPGPSDPSSHLMPQQPFHPCMFPKSCMFPTFNCTTNPHHAIYNDNVEVLATAGQNIDIISKFSAINDPIEIMKCHLMWGNSAPSAPDNLYSVPYEDDDPHIIDFIPDIYIAGCQDYYRRDYYHYKSGEEMSSQEDEELQNKIEDVKREQSPFNSPSIITSKTNRSVAKREHNFKMSKKETLLLTIPKFYETFSCVLINLNNLESHLLSFNN